MSNYKKLALAITIFVAAAGLSVASPAFAVQDNSAYHTPATALTDPNLVCGNHPCGPGETPQAPFPVIPVRGH
jgi:hypothetical protein